MKYGFIIDNRKCIGCHACTTACKSEHQVPVGVNRTWVKQVEKGTFPDTRRLFSVMRCNHCTDAPCVEICPTEALNIRDDGIVDFDKERCIGCKSCMQACPYDALYIDPDTHTAAKCNYCAHRIDVGLEPACVNVCPEHAIISGDMDDPSTEIAQLLARQAVKTRKPEKATRPNLFYIDADDISLIPAETQKSNQYFWSSQGLGVGHFAKAAEKLAFSNGDVLKELAQRQVREEQKQERVPKTIEVVLDKGHRIYDSPDKGILWGWEVSGYVWTKAISAGTVLMVFLAWLLGITEEIETALWFSIAIGLIFLLFTGVLLIKDLDRPDRFLYVLLRPHWGSWLVKGGYAITVYGGLLTLVGVLLWLGLDGLLAISLWASAIVAVIVAVYTAFLFAQAKGRDFWQSPTLALHMLVHAFMAGSATMLIAGFVLDFGSTWEPVLRNTLIISILFNLVVMSVEMITTHPTLDAKRTVDLILRGPYRNRFWFGVVLIGNLLPLVIAGWLGGSALAIASILVLIGIYITEQIWVEAPQRIPLS